MTSSSVTTGRKLEGLVGNRQKRKTVNVFMIECDDK